MFFWGLLLICILGVYNIITHPTYSSGKLVFTGLVEDVFIGGVNDVVIRLNKDPKRYFMNRGLEEGLTISQIRKDLKTKLWLLKQSQKVLICLIYMII